jgi:DNA modification methylase
MATLYQGHVLDLLAQLPEESVNCVVTSPPYWGLRKYAGEKDRLWDNHNRCEHEWGDELCHRESKEDSASGIAGTPRAGCGFSASGGQSCLKCGAWRGAYGLEPTIALYIQHSIEVLKAIKRVLRPGGVVFWNIADSYNGSGKKEVQINSPKQMTNGGAIEQRENNDTTLKPKDLCLIPERMAIAAQDAGWWVRSMIVWSKPNPMPESVTDRPTDAYENIIMLTKSARYWYDGEAVKEAAIDWGERDRTNGKYKVEGLANGLTGKQANHENRTYAGFNQRWGTTKPSPTRNLRNVWEIPTQPYKEAHFATFPEKIPERCILASCPQDGVVLEPFAGSGTTLAVAKRLGRKSIGIELSEQYCQLAIKRIQAVTLPMVTA